MQSGAHNPERVTPLLGLCHGVLTNRFISDISVRKAREPYLIKRGKTLEPLVIDKKDEMLYISPFVLFILFYISNFFDNSFNGLCGSMGGFQVNTSQA